VSDMLDGEAVEAVDIAMDTEAAQLFAQAPGSAEDLLNGATADLRRLYTPKLVVTADAYDHHGSSLTPVLVSCQNLPPWLRDSSGLQHLAMLVPRSVKNVQVLLHPLLEEISMLERTGLLVVDTARAGAPPEQTVRIYPRLVLVRADYRALVALRNMWQAPALVGACPHCDCLGHRCCSRTCYASGHSCLPDTAEANALKAEFPAMFPEVDWATAANERGPRGERMTTHTPQRLEAHMRRADKLRADANADKKVSIRLMLMCIPPMHSQHSNDA